MNSVHVNRYQSILFDMRRRLVRQIGDIEQSVTEDTMSPGEISNAPTHLGNIASSNPGVNIALAENEEMILKDVEAALERIEDGSFGRCESCGHEIGRRRLDAIPYTPLCTRCAHSQPAA